MTDTAAPSRFILRRGTDDSSFAADVHAGLTAVRKSIPPRYFYDDLGSALFEAICQLPEYPITRCEQEILSTRAANIAARLGFVDRLIELGSGNARKTRVLLEEVTRGARAVEYVPLDVDAALLQKVGRELIAQFPSLSVTAVTGDLRRPSRALRDLPHAQRTCILFLGSTIGNLSDDEAAVMLRDLRALLSSGDFLLLGTDLKKPKELVEAAYNDPLGVTAAFNLNLLRRINRELGGHFDLRCFAHRAYYNEEESRIEMHLVSLREQTVRIDALGLNVSFHGAETIHTENSYKYDETMVADLARRGGFEVTAAWTDSRAWFSDYLLAAR